MATIRNLLDGKGRDYWFVSPTDTVNDALRVFTDKRIGMVLVMEEDQLVGVFSERDFARLAAHSATIGMEIPVSKVMTSTVFFVTLDQSVEDCMGIMTEKKVRHLPVMERGHIVGIISIGDVVKELIADREAVIRGLENYIVGREFPT